MTNLQLEGDKAVFIESLADFISYEKTREELESIVRDVVLSELMSKDWEDVLDLADDYCFPAVL